MFAKRINKIRCTGITALFSNLLTEPSTRIKFFACCILASKESVRMSFALALVFSSTGFHYVQAVTNIFQLPWVRQLHVDIFLTFPETDSTPLVNSVMKPCMRQK